MLEVAVVSLLNGTVYGLLLFMLSSGLTLIFSMMGVLNIAHAGIFMLGAYFSYQIGYYLGFWPALVAAPLLCGLLGAAIERYGLRNVPNRKAHVPEILFTFGLLYVIEEVVVMLWGRNPLTNEVPEALDFTAFSVYGVAFPAYKVFMMAISVGIFVALYLALKRTRIGLIIQAALTHPQMVSALGHNVPAVYVLVFAIGSALAGLAGVIGGFTWLTAPNLAFTVGFIVFVVVVMGGLGSLAGAFVASMIIGLAQTAAVAINYSTLDLLQTLGLTVPEATLLHEVVSITLSELAPVVPYLLLVLMLIVRPRGLFGTRDA